jgi:5-methylcytosine-specific restriction endonuclease McrA
MASNSTAYMASYRAENREAIRANWHRWMAENPHAEAVYAAGRKARRLGVPSTLTVAEWKAIIDAHDGRCALCPKPYENMDHIVAFVSGGTNVKENVRPLCGECHLDKSRSELSIAGRRGAQATNARR